MNILYQDVIPHVVYITNRRCKEEVLSSYFFHHKLNLKFLRNCTNVTSEITKLLSNPKITLDAIIYDLHGTYEEKHQIMESLKPYSQLGKIVISSNQSDCIDNLKIGADDFLVRPVNIEELALRTLNVIRRINYLPDKSIQNDNIHIGEYTLNLETKILQKEKLKSALTDGEHQILLHLIGKRGKFSTREELSKAVGKKHHPMASRSVDMLIGRLRKKIQDSPKQPQYIITSRGKGYMLTSEHE